MCCPSSRGSRFLASVAEELCVAPATKIKVYFPFWMKPTTISLLLPVLQTGLCAQRCPGQTARPRQCPEPEAAALPLCPQRREGPASAAPHLRQNGYGGKCGQNCRAVVVAGKRERIDDEAHTQSPLLIAGRWSLATLRLCTQNHRCRITFAQEPALGACIRENEDDIASSLR